MLGLLLLFQHPSITQPSPSSLFTKLNPLNPNRLNLITTNNNNNNNNIKINKPHFTNPNLLKPYTISCSCTLHSIQPNPNPNPNPNPINPLTSIKPYVQSEYKTIINGWICSVVSVYTLSKLVPKVGNLSVIKSVERLRSEGLVIGGLCLVRLLSSYFQQSLLWEAALRAVYRVRVNVFERVLGRELGFFEGGDGKAVGDVAYRITAESSDVADTVFALLNVGSLLFSSVWSVLMKIIGRNAKFKWRGWFCGFRLLKA